MMKVPSEKSRSLSYTASSNDRPIAVPTTKRTNKKTVGIASLNRIITHLKLYKKSGYHYTLLNIVICTLIYSLSSLCFGSWFEVFYNTFSHGPHAHLELAVLALCAANIIHSAVGKLLDGAGSITAIKHANNILRKMLKNIHPSMFSKRHETYEKNPETRSKESMDSRLLDYFEKHNKLIFKFIYGASQGIIFLYYLIRLHIFFETSILMCIMIALNILTVKWNNTVGKIKKLQKECDNHWNSENHKAFEDGDVCDQQINASTLNWNFLTRLRKSSVQVRIRLALFENVFAVIPTILKKTTTPAFALLIICSKELALPLSGLFTPGTMAQALFCADAMWRHIGTLISEKSNELTDIQAQGDIASPALEQGNVLDKNTVLTNFKPTDITTNRIVFNSLYTTIATFLCMPWLKTLITLFITTNVHAALWFMPTMATIATTLTCIGLYQPMKKLFEKVTQKKNKIGSHEKNHWDIHLLASLIAFSLTETILYFSQYSIHVGIMVNFMPAIALNIVFALTYTVIHLVCAMHFQKHKYPNPTNLQIASSPSKPHAASHQLSIKSSISSPRNTSSTTKGIHIHTPLVLTCQRTNRPFITITAKNSNKISINENTLVTGILGVNGAGKSTLLRAIAQKFLSGAENSDASSHVGSLFNLDTIQVVGTESYLGVPQSSFTEKPLFNKLTRDGLNDAFKASWLTSDIKIDVNQVLAKMKYVQFLMARHLPESKHQTLIDNWPQHESSIQAFLTSTCQLSSNFVQTFLQAKYSYVAKTYSGGEMQKINAAIFRELMLGKHVTTLILDEPCKDVSTDVRPEIFASLAQAAKGVACKLLIVFHEAKASNYFPFDQILLLKVKQDAIDKYDKEVEVIQTMKMEISSAATQKLHHQTSMCNEDPSKYFDQNFGVMFNVQSVYTVSLAP